MERDPNKFVLSIGLAQTSRSYRSVIGKLADWEYFENRRVAEDAVASALSSPLSSSRFIWKLAREEQCGAALLEYVAQNCAPERLRPDLKKHSLDEARHARMYLALARLWTRSGGLPEPVKPTVAAKEELGPSFCDQFEDFIMSIHLAEIRNYALVTILGLRAEALSSQPALRLASVTSKLLEDEKWHVCYTGQIVDEMLKDDARASEKFAGIVDTYTKAQHQEIAHIRAFAD